MSIYQPYFYIIQDVRNGMYYAGAKWSKTNSNPKTFMIEGGYTTSSETIKSIIEKFGLETFIIRKLKTFETGDEAYNYETRFLQKVNARNHDKFYNYHNNDAFPSYGSIEYYEILIKKYDTKFPIQLQKFKDKTKETNLEKYGTEYQFQCENFKEKSKQTSLEKYGTEYPTQSDVIKNRTKETNLLKYNHISNLYSETQKKKNLDDFGFEFFSQSEEVKEKTRKNNLTKYGVEHIFQIEEVKEKIIKTNLDRYGETHYNKTKEARQNLSDKNQYKNKDGFFKGKFHSDETKEKISKSGKGRIHSEETRKLLSEANTGKKHTEETKEKLRLIQSSKIGELNQFFGKKHTEETRKLMSEKAKNRKKIECVYCNTMQFPASYYRNHGEKCKFK